MLLGDVQTTPVTDWSFVNDIPLCQIQIYAGIMPHAVNLNCMATPDGRALSQLRRCARASSGAATWKTTNTDAYASTAASIPVVFTRVTDEAELDRAWAARVKKLQVYGEEPYNPAPPPDAKRPQAWGSFHLRSAVD